MFVNQPMELFFVIMILALVTKRSNLAKVSEQFEAATGKINLHPPDMKASFQFCLMIVSSLISCLNAVYNKLNSDFLIL